MKTFVIEYRSATGRLRSVKIKAPSVDAAIETAVETLGIDFAAIQTTEERGA